MGMQRAQQSYPSVRKLAAWLGCERRAVRRGLRDLERLQMIRRAPEAGMDPAVGIRAAAVDGLPVRRRPSPGARANAGSPFQPPSRRTQRAKGGASAALPGLPRKGGARDTKGRRQRHAKGGAGAARSTLDRPRSTLKDSGAASASARPDGKKTGPERVLCRLEKLAHQVMAADPNHGWADLAEGLKRRAAQHQIPYDSAVIDRALCSAEFQRKRKGGNV